MTADEDHKLTIPVSEGEAMIAEIIRLNTLLLRVRTLTEWSTGVPGDERLPLIRAEATNQTPNDVISRFRRVVDEAQ